MSDEQNATETIEIPALDSVEALQSFVSALENNEGEITPASRGYTIKGGFRAVTPLYSLPISTLAGMGAAINSAMAFQASEGVEGAEAALALNIEHAQNAGTAMANEMQFQKFLGMAIQLGYGEDDGIAAGTDLGSIELPSREVQIQIVDAFMASQPKVTENSWDAWLKANG